MNSTRDNNCIRNKTSPFNVDVNISVEVYCFIYIRPSHAEGVHNTKSKVEALSDAPAPTNVAELRALLGLVQYYRRFV